MKILLSTGLAALLLATTAVARQKGPLFSPTVEISGDELVLNGQGVLRYKRIIPVYDAALYLPAAAEPAQALDSVVRRLEVVYRVGTRAKRFADAGDVVLARNYSPDAIGAIQDRLDRINALFPNPEKGDRCAITFVPNKGTELSFNGDSLGWIEGDDFGEAYFSIWLGEKPASRALRDDLLNLETNR